MLRDIYFCSGQQSIERSKDRKCSVLNGRSLLSFSHHQSQMSSQKMKHKVSKYMSKKKTGREKRSLLALAWLWHSELTAAIISKLIHKIKADRILSEMGWVFCIWLMISFYFVYFIVVFKSIHQY